MTCVRWNLRSAGRAKLLLDRILESVDLEVFFQMRASRKPANDRPVIGSPVELRLLKRLVGRMT